MVIHLVIDQLQRFAGSDGPAVAIASGGIVAGILNQTARAGLVQIA